MSLPDRIAALRTFALSLPDTTEEFPWGERVVKVKGKVFVFMGMGADAPRLRFSVKLPQRSGALVAEGRAVPTRYGLGKAGWVTFEFGADALPDDAEVRSWALESYRAVAPKRSAARIAVEV